MRQYLSNKTTKQRDSHSKIGSLAKKLFERTMANDEDIDLVSYFPILSLKIVTFVSRHNVHMWRSAGKQPYDDVRI